MMTNNTNISNTSVTGRSKDVPFVGISTYSKDIDTFLAVLYSTVGITAIVLNSLVCYLFAKGRVKTSAFNLLLLVLSISDLASVAGITPYVFIDVKTMDTSQTALNYLCGITIGISFYWTCTFVSIFVLCLISVNRYFFVNHRTKALWLRKQKTVWIAFFTFWPLAITVWTPNIFSFRYDKLTGVCYRDWPPRFSGVAYAFATILLGMVLPFALMVYTFVATVITLWSKQALNGTKSAVLKARKRVVSLLGILILVHIVCSLPAVVFWTLSRSTHVFPTGVEGEYLRMKIIRVVVLIALCNTVLDPVIYALRSTEFRLAFRNLISKTSQTMPKHFSESNQSTAPAPRAETSL